jgi:glycosyltransferase involved in cell wall biosynthesis
VTDILPKTDFANSLTVPAPTGRRMCIVTGELAGPCYNGGVGTANRALALVLRSLGHEVDILYTQVAQEKPFTDRGEFSDHVKVFRKLGIALTSIEHEGNRYDWLAMSHLCLQHLLQHRYDLVFFDDLFGNGYYSLLARRMGSAKLRATKMCVTAHSALQWISDDNQIPITTLADIRRMELERRSVELADFVKAPSTYILQQYSNYGWSLPSDVVVLPNFVSEHATEIQSPKRVAIKEIVFLGRLESRKGLWMFCRALDRLKYKLKEYQVTFLGKATLEDGRYTDETLVRRSAAWPFTIRLLNHYDREQAITYLKGNGRLAVMPVTDNGPSAILECLEHGIPFLTCSGGGGQELLDEKDWDSNLFEPSVEHLCVKLLKVLELGAVTARPRYDYLQLRNKFAHWLEHVLQSAASSHKPISQRSPNPNLIVVVPREFSTSEACYELTRAVEVYGGKLNVELLADNPAEIQRRLASSPESAFINISHASEFNKIAKAVACRSLTVTGLCHITQMLPPKWIERARVCFAADKSISALTGMVAHQDKSDADAGEAHVRAVKGNHQIERYLIGFAPPLFSLAQETNSGFVLMRSELLAKCSELGPIDEQYGRLKRMQDWIHEILVTLYASGERFELIPDEVMEQPVRESEFEVFRLERFMRSLPSKLYGYAPGTDQSVLTRFAIDYGLARERSIAHARYVRGIAERIGAEVEQLPVHRPWEQQARQLAMIAHASGQVELAIDLCSNLATEEWPSSLTQYVRRAAASETINLFEAFTALETNEMLSNPVNFDSDMRIVEMLADPTHAGVNMITIPFLDLSKITHFTSILAVPEGTTTPIRFRIELASRDKLDYWSTETILRGGERLWEFECPNDVRTECTVRFGVEIIDREGMSKKATTRWVNPRFIRRP